MPSAFAGPILLTVAFAAIGCAAGGGAVRFRGTVVGAGAAGAQYEDHPATGEPIASAVVRVCHCHMPPCVCNADVAVRTVRVDASGRYEVPDIAFDAVEDGMSNVFVVQADAPGFERVHYTLDGDRPTNEERAAREHPAFLNFRMRRAAR